MKRSNTQAKRDIYEIQRRNTHCHDGARFFLRHVCYLCSSTKGRCRSCQSPFHGYRSTRDSSQKLRRSVPHRKKMPDFRFILRTVTMIMMIMTILRMIPIIQTQVPILPIQLLPIQLLPTRTIPMSIHPLTTIMMTVPVIM